MTIMQFAEGLTDRQAAEAVATRIDWKYVLGLELTALSFDYSLLSEFRDRLLHGQAEQQLLDAMLRRFRELGLLRGRGRQRSDSTHVLAAVRLLNRLELVGETLRHGLEVLAEAAPAWLVQQITEAWFDRYSHRFEQFRLPKGQEERQALAESIGVDGYHLLEAVYAAGAPAELRQLPTVAVLRRVWLQQYYREDQRIHWRAAGNLPPATQMIQSPYDPEAHYSQKRTQEWVGYKAHLTETCDEDAPHLIVNVETTVATMPDSTMTDTIHAHLAQKDLLPASICWMPGMSTPAIWPRRSRTTPWLYRPGRFGYLLASQDAPGLRYPLLHDRLGGARSDLSPGAAQPPVVARSGCVWQ